MEIIKNISAKETYLVRQPVLRHGKPIESCHFEGDDLPTTHHFGLFYDKRLIGVVSVFSIKNCIFNSPNQFQIRGMAILSEYQKRGFGEKLLHHCEAYIKSQNGTLIWFNARESAISFYEKSNYNKDGAPFSIPEIGPHFLMKKEIDPL
jgi:ribosomal protein S18 acetylase RimI-like enzyme